MLNSLLISILLLGGVNLESGLTPELSYNESYKFQNALSQSVFKTVEGNSDSDSVDSEDGENDLNEPSTIPCDDFDNGMNMPDPEDPEDPEAPEAPEGSEDPGDPGDPEDPEAPEGSEDPGDLGDPEDPEDPGDPEDPEGPEEPEEPEVPVIEWPETMISGVLPVVYVNTENFAPIVDKEYKHNASFWIEIPDGCADKDLAFASREKPNAAVTIRGRGNASWLYYDKKPYKLKFDKKQSLLGMPENKHYVLLAEINSRGVGSTWGYELGNQLGMSWNPSFKPVELILNGNYVGIYLLMESIKIHENRLDIYEQPEENTDPETIPYGWLVEVDNYTDEFQISINERPGKNLKITHKSPEVVSNEQRTWLREEFEDILYRLNNDNPYSPTWTDKIDKHSFAIYFIVSEMQGNKDAYTGSFYLHKDIGEDAKWTVGPLWDLDYITYDEEWVFNLRPDEQVHFIKEALRFPCFIKEIAKVWKMVTPELMQECYNKVLEYQDLMVEPRVHDKVRWPEYPQLSTSFMRYALPVKYGWIRDNLSVLMDVATTVTDVTAPDNSISIVDGILRVTDSQNVADIHIFNVNGRLVAESRGTEYSLEGLQRGVYLAKVTLADGGMTILKFAVL